MADNLVGNHSDIHLIVCSAGTPVKCTDRHG